MEISWLDILMLLICVGALIRGFFTGFIMQLATLVGIVLGAIFSGKMAELISPYIERSIDASQQIISATSYLASFIIILIMVTLIGRLVNSLAKAILLDTVNKMAGAIFCMGKWILIVSILLNLVVMFDSKQVVIGEKIRNESYSYPFLIAIAQTIIPYLNFNEADIPLLPKSETNSSLKPI